MIVRKNTLTMFKLMLNFVVDNAAEPHCAITQDYVKNVTF